MTYGREKFHQRAARRRRVVSPFVGPFGVSGAVAGRGFARKSAHHSKWRALWFVGLLTRLIATPIPIRQAVVFVLVERLVATRNRNPLKSNQSIKRHPLGFQLQEKARQIAVLRAGMVRRIGAKQRALLVSFVEVTEREAEALRCKCSISLPEL
jgi:hypothetical protein